MEDMLRHFEKECSFHAVECLRCGKAVLHRELATHYLTGCPAGVSSARRTENASSDFRALTLQDLRNALEEVKTLLKDPNHDQVLPSIQSQVNELTEQVRNQESCLAEITLESRSVSAETAQVADCSAVLDEPTSCRSRVDGASTSSSSLYCSQKMLVNRKPEDFFDLSSSVLRHMRKTSTQDYPQHVIKYFGSSNVSCHLMLTRELSTARTWREVLGSVTYIVTIEKRDKAVLWADLKTEVCVIRVLHTKDSYFKVEVWPCFADVRTLFVEIKFLGRTGGLSLFSANFLRHRIRREARASISTASFRFAFLI
ncbi:hypothetical protein MTO96_032935 [Rhipicephalus appendiculatus]